ncbi:hypothetical protein [Phenylobacterium deserti]|uniref:Uncharacterized protein n=1 Tax=Phenylobacterium deserti TaxID=1914756 RepID=A0A328ASF7_9CAUL|nr:hypothetical protein [Phenylobacterium deserti]RAK57479.1 hypothetical protein DJ018_05940 [Phenylobacterium deserti]
MKPIVTSRQSGVWVCGMAAAGLVTAIPAAAAPTLTLESAKSNLVTINDPLEVEVVLSTERVAPSTRGLFKSRFNDAHLKAHVHKATGAVRFEVHQTFNYAGPHRGYDRVSYATDGLPQTAVLTQIENNRDHCQAWDSGMECLEAAAFEIGEADLRRLAEAATDSAGAWELKFKPAAGKDLRVSIPRAEIQGLLWAVDQHRATSGAAVRTAALAAAPEVAD